MSELADDLEQLKLIIDDRVSGTPFCANDVVEGIKSTWYKALISDVADHTLQRYFGRQLAQLSVLLDNVSANKEFLTLQICGLINHLYNCYRDFFDYSIAAPRFWQEQHIAKLQSGFDRLFQDLKRANMPSELKECLREYISETEESLTFRNNSFSTFFFNNCLIDNLTPEVLQYEKADDAIFAILVGINFNYLPYLVYLQGKAEERLKLLEDDEARISKLKKLRLGYLNRPVKNQLSCKPGWPSLNELMLGWINELLADLFSARAKANLQVNRKLMMDIPATHLACWIRLFHYQGYFKTESLNQVIEFFAAHISTKRQTSLSPRSLSKEYYSISQITAARVRQALLEMNKHITTKFFP